MPRRRCQHHWKLGPGITTTGVCTLCGRERRFDGGDVGASSWNNVAARRYDKTSGDRRRIDAAAPAAASVSLDAWQELHPQFPRRD